MLLTDAGNAFKRVHRKVFLHNIATAMCPGISTYVMQLLCKTISFVFGRYKLSPVEETSQGSPIAMPI